MEYRKIISVTGLTGLYELVGSKKDGAIVRSLEDNVTKFVAQRIHNFSHLESIEVYTVRDNVNLTDVLTAMQSSKEPLPDDKDGAAVKAYFQKVYPDMDFGRVYASDMKKMVKWYSILKANDVEIKLSEEAQDTETKEAETAKAETAEAVAAEEAPARAEAPVEKKPKAKAAKPATDGEEVKAEKKPAAKKTAAKKD